MPDDIARRPDRRSFLKVLGISDAVPALAKIDEALRPSQAEKLSGGLLSTYTFVADFRVPARSEAKVKHGIGEFAGQGGIAPDVFIFHVHGPGCAYARGADETHVFLANESDHDVVGQLFAQYFTAS